MVQRRTGFAGGVVAAGGGSDQVNAVLTQQQSKEEPNQVTWWLLGESYSKCAVLCNLRQQISIHHLRASIWVATANTQKNYDVSIETSFSLASAQMVTSACTISPKCCNISVRNGLPTLCTSVLSYTVTKSRRRDTRTLLACTQVAGN